MEYDNMGNALGFIPPPLSASSNAAAGVQVPLLPNPWKIDASRGLGCVDALCCDNEDDNEDYEDLFGDYDEEGWYDKEEEGDVVPLNSTRNVRSKRARLQQQLFGNEENDDFENTVWQFNGSKWVLVPEGTVLKNLGINEGSLLQTISSVKTEEPTVQIIFESSGPDRADTPLPQMRQ